MATDKECASGLDRLMTDIRVKVPGAVDEQIKLNLFNVVDQHLRKTNAWRNISQVDLRQGLTTYPIFPPSGTALVRVLEATHSGHPVMPVQGGGTASGQRGRLVPDEYHFPEEDPGYYADEITNEGGVFRYAVYYPNYVTITVPPDKSAIESPMNIVMAITLGRESLSCDCGEWSVEPWMWDRYFDDWLNGVLGVFYGEPFKPWSNPTLAMFHQKRFRGQIGFARQEAARGFVFDRPMWRFPRVGGFVR
jgi:hypothetical protein